MRSSILLCVLALVACGGSKLELVTSSLPSGTEGQPYSAQLESRGGDGAHRWRLSSGSLPPGLTLGAVGTKTNTLSGTPTSAGTYEFGIAVEDARDQRATRTFTVVIEARQVVPLTIDTAALPDGQVGAAYQQDLVASGGSGAGYVWALSTGSLPPGLTIVAGSPARLSGTPTHAGRFDFELRVVDSANASQRKTYSVTVAPAPVALAITTASLPAGQVGAAYSATLNAVGGSTSGYSWAVSAGALPPGLQLAASGTPGAALDGTPTAAGTFSFTVRVTDSAGAQATAQLSIVVAAAVIAVQIAPPTLPSGTVGVPYQADIGTVPGTGSDAGYTWSVASGALPPGITLQLMGTPSTRVSGTPTTAGTYTATLQVFDSNVTTDTEQVTIEVLDAVVVTTMTVPNGVEGTAYAPTQLAATGGTGMGFMWSVSAGALPAGLTLSASGLLSGTPTANGTFDFTARVVDSSGRVGTRAFMFTIAPGLSIVTATLPPGRPGISYSATLTAAGGTGSGRMWSVSMGALPGGLMLSAAGVITGTPAMTGSSTFTVQVTDSGGGLATRQLTIDVNTTVTDRWLAWVGDTRVDAVLDVVLVPLPPAPVTPVVVNPTAVGGIATANANAVAFSPDGTKLAYIGDFLSLGLDEVFMVDISGQMPGMPVRVSGNLVSGGVATGLRWSPDSTRIAYVAEQDTDGVIELYVVDVSGGAPGPSQKVNGPLIAAGDVILSSVQWSPTGDRLGYLADAAVDGQDELFVATVSTTGVPGTAQRVNGALPTGTDVNARWLWTPNGARVIYEAPQTGTATEVFLVDVSGAMPSAPVRLNGTLVTGGAVGTVSTDVAVSFDGSWVSYVADQDTDNVEEVYVVNIAGATPGTPLKVSGVMPSFGDNINLKWSPTANRLVYCADQQTSGVYEIFLVSITGGTPSAPLKIHPTFPSFGRVAAGSDEILWSPDGNWVAYRADTAVDNAFEVEAVNVSGAMPGAPIDATLPRVTGLTTDGFLWSPDSTAIAARGEGTNDNLDQLFVTKVVGPNAGTVVTVTQVPGSGGQVSSMVWAGDSRHMLLEADLSVDGVFEPYLVDTQMPTLPVPSLVPSMPSGGDVSLVISRQP